VRVLCSGDVFPRVFCQHTNEGGEPSHPMPSERVALQTPGKTPAVVLDIDDTVASYAGG
jgi:hypothetical protein